MSEFERPASYDVSANTGRQRIDTGESGSFTFTVTNKSGTSLNTGVKVRVEGDLEEASCTIEKGEDRILEPNDGVQYEVKVKVPESTPTGSSKVTLIAYYVDKPNEVFMRGPWVQVDHAKPNRRPKWIIPALVAAGVLILALAIIIAVSGGDPTVQLDATSATATPDERTFTGLTPMTISFSAVASDPPESWTWDFGNISENVPNPEERTEIEVDHTFEEPGEHTVLVFANYDLNIRFASDPWTIAVDLPVAATMEVINHTGNSPLTVRFKDLSNALSRTWDFGVEGSETSTEPSVTHIYTNDHPIDPKTFTATLSVVGGGEGNSSETTQLITVRPQSKASFTVAPRTGYFPLTVQFTDTSQSPESWDWDFGDGGTSTHQSPSHRFAGKGEHTVNLTLGTGAVANQTVKVYERPRIEFTASRSTIAQGDTVTFTWKITGDATAANLNFGDARMILNLRTLMPIESAGRRIGRRGIRGGAIGTIPRGAVIRGAPQGTVAVRPQGSGFQPTGTKSHQYVRTGSFLAKLTVTAPMGNEQATTRITVVPRIPR